MRKTSQRPRKNTPLYLDNVSPMYKCIVPAVTSRRWCVARWVKWIEIPVCRAKTVGHKKARRTSDSGRSQFFVWGKVLCRSRATTVGVEGCAEDADDKEDKGGGFGDGAKFKCQSIRIG